MYEIETEEILKEEQKYNLKENELEKYQIELKEIFNELEKINEVKDYDDDIIITPTIEKCKLRKDEIGPMLNNEEMLKNVPRHNGNYIEVPVVINE